MFPVGVGLRQGCALSLNLFVAFMDRISRCIQREESMWYSIGSNPGIVPDHCGEKGAELVGKTFDLPLDAFQPSPELGLLI